MLNRLITVILIFVGLNTANAQYDLRETERERMAKAKVKVQTEFTHDYKNGQPSAQGYKSAVRKFDVKGNLTEEANYNATGKAISVITYQYDNKNNRVNHERYQGEREKLQYSQKIVYDPAGNKTREYGFDGAASYSNTYKYDAGKLVEISYMADNNLVEKRKLSYSGNKSDIQIFDSSNKLTFKQENSYNALGHLLSEIKTDNTGKLIYTITCEYKDDKLLLSEAKKRKDALEYKKVYHYDNENRLIKEETVNMDGTKFVSHEYRYNNASYLELESWKKNHQSKEASSKKMDYGNKGIYTEIESYFATYKFFSLYKYTYEFY
jgi:hypothetical protein